MTRVALESKYKLSAAFRGAVESVLKIIKPYRLLSAFNDTSKT